MTEESSARARWWYYACISLALLPSSASGALYLFGGESLHALRWVLIGASAIGLVALLSFERGLKRDSGDELRP